MPCFHKFLNYLNLEHLDFEPTTLVVGTFNPEWPVNNNAEWFYGRTQNNYFWDVLPRIYGEQSLINGDHIQWKQFCQNNSIAITDLISCLENADIANQQHQNWLANYADANIAANFNHIFVNIIQILETHPAINNVYFTRGLNGDNLFWANRWAPIIAYCIENNIRFRQLLTPSGNARFQLGRYNNQNPDNQLNLPDFILMRWLQQWH